MARGSGSGGLPEATLSGAPTIVGDSVGDGADSSLPATRAVYQLGADEALRTPACAEANVTRRKLPAADGDLAAACIKILNT